MDSPSPYPSILGVSPPPHPRGNAFRSRIMAGAVLVREENEESLFPASGWGEEKEWLFSTRRWVILGEKSYILQLI